MAYQSKRVIFTTPDGHTIVVDGPFRPEQDVAGTIRAALAASGPVGETGPLLSEDPPLAERDGELDF